MLTLGDTPRLGPLESNPVLGPGPLGGFDDRGVTVSCVVTRPGAKYLYYTGWMVGVTVPFYFYIGLAISTDDGRTYRRVSDAPVVDRCDGEAYLTASPCVVVEGSRWRMWYVSGTGWEPRPDGPRHRYHIRYTESADGVRWQRPGYVAIDCASADEYALSRPCVVRDADGYRMWYAFRGEEYRIGAAVSTDGLTWTRRDDELGLPPSGTAGAWDSHATAYPWVLDAGGQRYLLYNGNGYGRTGVGAAVWEPAR